MVPDAEAIVTAVLKADATLKGTGARVVGASPEDKSTAWVQVTQLDYPAVEGHRSEHLLEWMGQLDCYAGARGGQGEASAVTRAARQAISALPGQSISDAVITGARVLSAPRILDTDLEPARERYCMTVSIFLHGT